MLSVCLFVSVSACLSPSLSFFVSHCLYLPPPRPPPPSSPLALSLSHCVCSVFSLSLSLSLTHSLSLSPSPPLSLSLPLPPSLSLARSLARLLTHTQALTYSLPPQDIRVSRPVTKAASPWIRKMDRNSLAKFVLKERKSHPTFWHWLN